MSKSTTALNEQTGHTLEELKALIKEAEAALAKTGNEAGEEVLDLRDRLRSAFTEGKNAASQAAELARKQAIKADELVRANPYASIGIGTATGLLLGCLLARTNASRS
jgi:ElaB/YqjD/DUF883 family membrane-anchored ribosome-binding protein